MAVLLDRLYNFHWVNRAVARAAQAPDPTLLAGVQAILAPVQGVSWHTGRPENH